MQPSAPDSCKPSSLPGVNLGLRFPEVAILELRGVSKQFATHKAVDDISLALEAGRFYSLLGPSGCGKTTTLRLVAGFEMPSEGDIFLECARVNDRPPYQRNVSTVFQSYALFPHLTVEQNIAFGLKQRRAPDIPKRVAAALELVQLSGKRGRLPAELSGGEKQRVALARSLVVEPAVLLLDEPLAALDLKLRRAMRAELRAMQRRTGITFLFVTHDQEEALAMSDELVILNKGRIEQTGDPQHVYENPRTRFVADFLGTMNWIGNIGIRPENITLSHEGQGLRGQVAESLFLGNLIQLLVTLSSGEQITVDLPPERAQFYPGQSVAVSWSPSSELRLP